ncbi:MAG: hypothetical protein IPP68_03685 [Elusimicrobia bacterium]|nr:hypothetical protein [Elusimicrobiota bacterium]
MVETSVNAVGGHPVSMQNIRKCINTPDRSGRSCLSTPAGCGERVVHPRTGAGYAQRSIADIVREFCSHSDGCTMSATKDFPVDVGGFLATRREDLHFKFQDRLMLVGEGLSVDAKARLYSVLRKSLRSEKALAPPRPERPGALDPLKSRGSSPWCRPRRLRGLHRHCRAFGLFAQRPTPGARLCTALLGVRHSGRREHADARASQGRADDPPGDPPGALQSRDDEMGGGPRGGSLESAAGNPGAETNPPPRLPHRGLFGGIRTALVDVNGFAVEVRRKPVGILEKNRPHGDLAAV